MNDQAHTTDGPVRTFTTKGKQRKAVTFALNDEVTFTVRPMIPGSMLLEHAERLSSADAVAAAELIRIWRDLLDTTREIETVTDEETGRPVQVEDDDGRPVFDSETGEPVYETREVEGSSEYDRFRAYIDHPDNEVEVQDLGEILRWVLGRLTNRPTTPSSPSPRGRSTSGTPSTSGSVPAGATSRPITSLPQ